jgi:hypothetical protein
LAYAEIYVTPTLWPEFRGLHLLEGIAEYQKRERRYGGLAGDAHNGNGAHGSNQHGSNSHQANGHRGGHHEVGDHPKKTGRS